MKSSPPQTQPQKSQLRIVREAQGLSLRRVSHDAEIDLGHLSRVERGQAGLSIDALARIASVLGLRQLAEMLEPYRGPGP